MHHYFEAITNTKGDALTGYYVKLVDSGGSVASLYADTSATPIISVSGLADAAQVDSDGNVDFYVAVGTYRMDIYATDGSTLVKSIDDIPCNIDVDTIAVNYVSTRTALAGLSAESSPVLLTEAGREGTFYWSSADNSASVTADTSQGVFVARSADTTGATGAWVRKFSGAIDPLWFGVTANGVTNDGPAMLVVKAVSDTMGAADLTGYGTAAYPVQLPLAPNGINMGTSTVSFTKTATWRGFSGGTFGGASTFLKWSNGCNGFEVHAQNCRFDGITLSGSWADGTAEGEFHAIKAYYKFGSTELFIQNWQGDGLHADISAGSGGDTEGNVNNCHFGRISIKGCRNGVYWKGADANASLFSSIDVNFCRQAGLYLRDFLGTTVVAPSGSGNGIQGATGITTFSCCYSSGHIYYAKVGQETWCSTNAPSGTTADNTGWLYWKDAGAATAYAPTWGSGMSVRIGGHVITDNANASTTIINPYGESDMPPIQCEQATLVVNGQLACGARSDTRRIWATNSGVNIAPDLVVTRSIHAGTLINTVSGLNFGADAENPNASLSYVSGNYYAQMPNAGQLIWRNISTFAVWATLDETTGLLSKSRLGFMAGAGGAVTQITSKSTGVTLNKACGQITMQAAALAAAAKVSFVVTNSTVAATDVVIPSIASGGTANAYRAAVTAVAAGSFTITVENITAGSLSEAPVINFSVIKAVAA